MGLDKAEVMARLLATADTNGISPAEFMAYLTAAPAADPGPTVAEYLPIVVAATTGGARRTYQTYWALLVDTLGDRLVGDIKTSELAALALSAEERALRRANHRSGRHARESAVAAMRRFFTVAARDGLVVRSPAADLALPRRPKSRRRALTDDEIAQLWQITAETGNDPALDLLVFRFHLETGARRGAGVALTLDDLDHHRQCVRLHEKFDEEWWQPCSMTLLNALEAHATARGAHAPTDPVLVYASGKAVTSRRHDYIIDRWKRLAWARKAGVSTHWLRHTAIDTIRNIAGEAVASRFAGHAAGNASNGVTGQYGPATEAAVARAVAIMTGEAHPLDR
jgi:integrase/recombinase XerC